VPSFILKNPQDYHCTIYSFDFLESDVRSIKLKATKLGLKYNHESPKLDQNFEPYLCITIHHELFRHAKPFVRWLQAKGYTIDNRISDDIKAPEDAGMANYLDPKDDTNIRWRSWLERRWKVYRAFWVSEWLK
jgi:hypothetical protein